MGDRGFAGEWSAVLRVCGGPDERDRTRESGGTVEGLLHRILGGGRRRSVEPIAAVIAPAGVSAQHQRLLQFVADSASSDAAMLARCKRSCCQRSSGRGGRGLDHRRHVVSQAGKHSVGVHRQYCGQLGKQANCQAVVTLSVANHAASLPIAYRLYLPKEWTEDAARRKKARIPEEITFKTKPQIRSSRSKQRAPGWRAASC